MKHIKPTTLGLMKKPYQLRGQHYLVVSALGFFRLGVAYTSDAQDQNFRFLPDSQQWQKLLHVLPAGQAVDEIMPKARSEVLLTASAHAPQGKPVTELTVSLQLESWRKQLRVIGDRRWVNSLLPLYQVSEPAPFTQMPLSWERAYGGPRHTANPQGRGYTGHAMSALFGVNRGVLPNLEDPHAPVLSPAKAYAPAGVGPLPLHWSPRRERFGSFDQYWIEHDAPGLAADTDPLAFNRAPADQWLPQPLVGGEAYCLEHLHPQHPRIAGVLPGFVARGFVQRHGGELEEVALQPDTVWFFPEQDIGLLIYHGQIEIDDAEAQDITAVMVAYEDAQAPRSMQHYRDVFALRSDADTAPLHLYNESQLAPLPGDAVLAGREAQRQAEALARQARVETATAGIQQDLCERYDLPLPTPGVPAGPVAMQTADTSARLSAQEIADGDFDLTGVVAQARARADQARTHGEQQMARLQQMKAELQATYGEHAGTATEHRLAGDTVAQKNAAFDLACVPAYDLLPADSQALALAPAVDAMLANLKLPAPQDPAVIASLREKFSQSLLQLPALRRRGRHAAMTPSAPAQALAPEVAAWLGLQIRQWHQGGALLAGRDLAGIDLREADLRGADLREVMLEQADLRGACLAGANLEGAVLCGAMLDGADFTDARLHHANLCASSAAGTCFAGADLRQARVSHARWQGSTLRAARLNDCLAQHIDLTSACLDLADLRGASLLQAQAPHSSWQGASLDKTVLLKAVLDHADFSRAQLQRVTLLDASLVGSRWQAANLVKVVAGGTADWSGADLRDLRAAQCGWHGARFCGADLSDAHCLRCTFDTCDFDAARLHRTLLANSRFMNARFHRADAMQADFYQAMCRKTDFSDANLHLASLIQADLSGADLTGATLTQTRLDDQRRAA
ncbi:pentapeptide repeat-containing protein [Herbaspirillum rubrisubalbicans M1]|uniref:DUF2169 family type VI secretion system accessory protein n=1 Tax=Herbaspirillum rubrisubalbicans TaxID=80842 RepID=UPI000739FC48|nr:DUF2169 domain-containing protein [Herbaspirillum rubrisubalbicans]ALU89499.1 pentapeptide repeat-containing protein [Herbaspirillum rubrisubalbicans M1]